MDEVSQFRLESYYFVISISISTTEDLCYNIYEHHNVVFRLFCDEYPTTRIYPTNHIWNEAHTMRDAISTTQWLQNELNSFITAQNETVLLYACESVLCPELVLCHPIKQHSNINMPFFIAGSSSLQCGSFVCDVVFGCR